MTNNENENDIDIDAQEDFEKEPQQKASLKETWDSNPLLKIAAVILGFVVLAGAYFIFIGQDEEINNSIVGGNTGTKQIVGKDVNDPVYAEKVKQQNIKRAEDAANTGGSAVPTPVGPSEAQTLSIPTAPAGPQGDPLAEWRAKTEAKRVQMEAETIPEEKEAEQPEVVPMVQPIHPQPTMKMDPNASRLLADQMRAIIATQEPKQTTRIIVTQRDSAFAAKVKKERAEAQKKNATPGGGSGGGGGAGGANASPAASKGAGCGAAKGCPIIVTAGSIAYAQLINDLNSDVEGPALAQVLSGPFEGGRAIGEFKKEDEYLTLSFKRIIKDGVSYKVEAVAIDEKTSLTGLQSDVEHHYFQRLVLPAAADFIKGFADAASQTGTTTTTTAGGGVASNTPKPSTHEILMKGVNDAAETAADIVKEDAKRPITVKLKHGTTFGLLFLEPVTTSDAEG